eukprot:845656-Rhodomonas_salina.5
MSLSGNSHGNGAEGAGRLALVLGPVECTALAPHELIRVPGLRCASTLAGLVTVMTDFQIQVVIWLGSRSR